MPNFLEDYPVSVAITTITYEWEKHSANGVIKRTQLPLNLSWEFTIHKIQGKKLELLVIDLGAGDKRSGLTLVALSKARMFKHLLVKPLTFERLRKANTSSGLVDTKNSLATLEQKALATRLQYPTVSQDKRKLYFTLFHLHNFHLFKQFALRERNSGQVFLPCYCYKTTLKSGMIFTKDYVSTSDEQVEKFSRELNIHCRACVVSLIYLLYTRIYLSVSVHKLAKFSSILVKYILRD